MDERILLALCPDTGVSLHCTWIRSYLSLLVKGRDEWRNKLVLGHTFEPPSPLNFHFFFFLVLCVFPWGQRNFNIWFTVVIQASRTMQGMPYWLCKTKNVYESFSSSQQFVIEFFLGSTVCSSHRMITPPQEATEEGSIIKGKERGLVGWVQCFHWLPKWWCRVRCICVLKHSFCILMNDRHTNFRGSLRD